MNTNDGGPAFPVNEIDISKVQLRDWFAGMALQGLLACSGIHSVAQDCQDSAFKASAEWSYRIADAMLREREKGGRDG